MIKTNLLTPHIPSGAILLCGRSWKRKFAELDHNVHPEGNVFLEGNVLSGPHIRLNYIAGFCRCTEGTLWRPTTGPVSMLASGSLAPMLRSDKTGIK